VLRILGTIKKCQQLRSTFKTMHVAHKNVGDHVGSIDQKVNPNQKGFFFNNIKMKNNFYEKKTLWDIF